MQALQLSSQTLTCTGPGQGAVLIAKGGIKRDSWLTYGRLLDRAGAVQRFLYGGGASLLHENGAEGSRDYIYLNAS